VTHSSTYPNVREISSIVPVILRELARLRAAREIPQDAFVKKLNRLTEEELSPRNLDLVVQDLCGGRTRFIIEDRLRHAALQVIDYGGVQGNRGDKSASLA